MHPNGKVTLKLLLVGGFLGSGKTTLILQLAHTAVAAGQRVAILVNEVGELGIDDQFMRRLGLSVWELLNGCICCTLTADLVTALQTLDADYRPELVILEPSGVAESGNILSALPYYRGTPLEAIRTISVVDPQRLPILLEVLTPLVTAQIQAADTILINKIDVATPEEIAAARRAVAEINPDARLVVASAKTGVAAGLLKELLP